MKIHLEQSVCERAKLNKHREKCKREPEKYIGVVVDGMDQQKTNIPHFPRPPKLVDPNSCVQIHLVGCLVFSRPITARVFLNYPNLHNDSNLVITILQAVLHEFETERILPPVLYLQLDNTARENKNNLLMSYLHHLVAQKVFRKIKVGFLIVGHTHDNIDQMFSHFSRRLARQKAFTTPKLMSIIESAYTPTPRISVLCNTFDFRKSAFAVPKIITSSIQNLSFNHQFKIAISRAEDKLPAMWAKKFSSTEEWSPEGGATLLREDYVIRDMYYSPRIPLVRKGERGEQDSNPTPLQLEGNITAFEKHILLLQRYLSNEDLSWWEAFFEEQRSINVSHFRAHVLATDFVLPRFAADIAQVPSVGVVDVELDPIDTQVLEENVHGQTRDIYVGVYRNPRIIEREKENMEGDLKDLLTGKMICVSADGDPNERPFFLAKVEKIDSYLQNGIPHMISILWYSCGDGLDIDPYTAKYNEELKQGESSSLP